MRFSLTIVLRIQSHAQVIFSDPIVIRYGSGVTQNLAVEDMNEVDVANQKIPCPLLEFRVINQLSAQLGGEIMDANLSVVANIDANDADPAIVESLTTGSRSGGNLRERKTSSLGITQPPHFKPESATTSHHSEESVGRTESFSESKIHHPGKVFNTHTISSLLHRQFHNAVDEDPSARLVNKRIFSKMMIEASEHPFFKRAWLARHVLDETSPILKPKVRRQIRRNQGYWPSSLNSYEAVRNSLQFNQILVSLNGVSNVSASDVYAQKIYDFVDVSVGYQFVNCFYKDADGLKVDIDLINDVHEQQGGGGEPLIRGE